MHFQLMRARSATTAGFCDSGVWGKVGAGGCGGSGDPVRVGPRCMQGALELLLCPCSSHAMQGSRGGQLAAQRGRSRGAQQRPACLCHDAARVPLQDGGDGSASCLAQSRRSSHTNSHAHCSSRINAVTHSVGLVGGTGNGDGAPALVAKQGADGLRGGGAWVVRWGGQFHSVSCPPAPPPVRRVGVGEALSAGSGPAQRAQRAAHLVVRSGPGGARGALGVGAHQNPVKLGLVQGGRLPVRLVLSLRQPGAAGAGGGSGTRAPKRGGGCSCQCWHRQRPGAGTAGQARPAAGAGSHSSKAKQKQGLQAGRLVGAVLEVPHPP